MTRDGLSAHTERGPTKTVTAQLSKQNKVSTSTTAMARRHSERATRCHTICQQRACAVSCHDGCANRHRFSPGGPSERYADRTRFRGRNTSWSPAAVTLPPLAPPSSRTYEMDTVLRS